MNLRDYNLYLDDPFAATRMPFGDHLEELRLRLWRGAGGLVVVLVLVFVADFTGYATKSRFGIGRPMLEVIDAPVERELQKYYERSVERVSREIQSGQIAGLKTTYREEVPLELEVHELARALGPHLGVSLPAYVDGPADRQFIAISGRIPPFAWARALNAAQARLTRRNSLKVMGPMEGFMVYFKVALACGVVLASPWIFWQIWGFLAAGLYPHEKRGLYSYLPVALGLFLAGVLGCQFLVMPRAVETLLGFNDWLGFELDLRVSEWLSFAIWMPLVFGLSFQTPLAMLVLERVGLTTTGFYREKRRLAWFLLGVLAVLIIPAMDLPSMLLLWLPLGLLYELGIWFCRLAPGRRPTLTDS
jgi:sec-independent protein translocase protein TatC